MDTSVLVESFITEASKERQDSCIVR